VNAEQRRAGTVDPTSKHWAARLANAQTPAQLAVVEWDRVRARVRGLPEQDQPKAWQDLKAVLQTARQKIEGR
jgi:hypothetical protein